MTQHNLIMIITVHKNGHATVDFVVTCEGITTYNGYVYTNILVDVGCFYRWTHEHIHSHRPTIQYYTGKTSMAPNSSGNLSSVTHPNKAFGHVTRALLRLERTMNLLCH